jgi:hypothetical protein
LPGDLRNSHERDARLIRPFEKATIHFRRNTMKFETAMLHSLFAACLVICVTLIGSMLA